MLSFLTLATITVGALGQSPGNGISKQTYATTDPQASFTWFAKYLPIHCGDPVQMCNSSDADCGQKGRANLCSEASNVTCTGNAMNSFMFHMVNTSARPSGKHTVAEVEAIFDEKMSAAFATRRYDAFMDFSVAFWAPDLDIYISLLSADGVPFLVLTWKDNTGTTYYSLIIHGPHTQVVVELISRQKPAAEPEAHFVQDHTVRYTSGIFYEMGVGPNQHQYPVSSNRLRPLCVSKATSDMSQINQFYEQALLATQEWNVSYPDGTHISYWNPGFADMADKMQVRFVQRNSSWTTSSLSVKQLEGWKFSGHDMVTNVHNNSANIICGFDKWYDNHYAIDGGKASLNEYKSAFDSYDNGKGWPYYQAWGGAPGPENIYVVDPTGDAIQLDSGWEAGTAPAGVAGDALGTMCSQANCKAGQRPTPAACTTALASRCPGLSLQNSKCSDCVYTADTWAFLSQKDCLNSDVVAYCVGQ